MKRRAFSVAALVAASLAAGCQTPIPSFPHTLQFREADTHKPVPNAVVMIAVTGGSPPTRTSTFFCHKVTDGNGACMVALDPFVHYDIAVVSPRHIPASFVVEIPFMQKHFEPPSWRIGTQPADHPHVGLAEHSSRFYSNAKIEMKAVPKGSR